MSSYATTITSKVFCDCIESSVTLCKLFYVYLTRILSTSGTKGWARVIYIDIEVGTIFGQLCIVVDF